MKRRLQDFEIDELTNSIVNTISKESFPTAIVRVVSFDLKLVTAKNGWRFGWKKELKQSDRDVYKLTTVDNPHIIHGLLSLSVREKHVFIHLIENAPFNVGRNKLYEGIPANLVAFACKLSLQNGGEGVVSFYSKTKLIEHYVKMLRAVHAGGHLMIVDERAARSLINKYFPSNEE